MGVLDRFEKGLEKVVNGAFAKAFRSQVEPVELAGALRREEDTRAAVVSRGRTLTANKYTIELSTGDFERLEPVSHELQADLRQVVGDHAIEQGYSFVGPVTVEFSVAEDLDTGMYRVLANTQRPDGTPAAQPASRGGYDPESRANPVVPEAYEHQNSKRASQPQPVAPYQAPPQQAAPYTSDPRPVQPHVGNAPGAGSPNVPDSTGAAVAAVFRDPQSSAYPPQAGSGSPEPVRRTQPAVEFDGRVRNLPQGTTVFGRSSNSADVVLNDPGVSRRHFEITIDGDHAVATDLGSTNGTSFEGRRITSITLTDGVELTAGDTRIIFRETEVGGR